LDQCRKTAALTQIESTNPEEKDMADVKPIPEGYHSVTPYLIIDGASAAIDFYKKAFGAIELFRMDHGGKVGHAELKIGDSPIMLADPQPPDYVSPKRLNGTPVSLMIYVEDVDTIYNRAIGEGGVEMKALQDQFYGDRSGTLKDPFGHIWTVATHKEDVTPEEMEKRIAAAHKASA
jgi:PhnB protein